MRRLLVLSAVATLALVGCSGGDEPVVNETVDVGAPTDVVQTPSDAMTSSESPTSDVATSEPAEGAVESVAIRATLTGDVEVPGPGDPGASGVFEGTIELLEASGELCYSLEATALGSEATAAHIHTGEAGVAGGVAVALKAPVGETVEECIPLDAGVVNDLIQNPDNFYVNVHSAQFADGAVRGQVESA